MSLHKLTDDDVHSLIFTGVYLVISALLFFNLSRASRIFLKKDMSRQAKLVWRLLIFVNVAIAVWTAFQLATGS